MNAAKLIALLRASGLRIFTTADALALTGLNPPAATHALSRLAAQGILSRLKRGVWADLLAAPLDPYEAVPALAAPWPAYVSLYSALADHGVLLDIPQVVYAVSPAPPKSWSTPLGEFRFHHLPARLIWGFEARRTGAGSCLMAEPEKAFLDLAYLALSPRSPLNFPPKREKGWELDRAKVARHAARFASERLTAWLKQNRLIPP